MPSSTKEVFERFKADHDEEDITPYVAYALFAESRYQWMDHIAAQAEGAAPDTEREKTWIEDLTNPDFERYRARATDFLSRFSRVYLAEEIEQARRDGEQAARDRALGGLTERIDGLNRRVNARTRFWASFWPNFVAGFAATFVFAVGIAGLTFVVLQDASLASFVRGLLAGEPPAAP